MSYSRIVTIVAAGAAVFALGGAAAQGGAGTPHGPGHHGAAAGAATMPHMMGGSSELDFLAHMLEHHREAVSSAEVLLALAQRDELIALAREVIEAQQAEIDMMQAWLDEWYPEWEPMHDYVPMMRPLAGMAPADAERAWVEDMVAHHMMAVHEAQTLLAGSLSDRLEVLELARSIVRDQQREIATMQGWLRDWYGAAPPAAMGAMAHGPGQAPMAGNRMMGEHGTMTESMMRRTMAAHHGHGGPRRTMHGAPAPMRGMMGICPASSRSMTPGGMPGARAADPAGIEALARAFLAGRGADAEILEVQPPANVHRVTYRDGDEVRVLLVDADSGAVKEE